MTDLAGEKVAYLGFCGLIDSAGVTKIASTLNIAVNEQFGRAYLCITTPGGYVGDGIYLYNHIRSLPIPVTLHNTGTVASIGATLFTASDQRFCSPNAVFMMHPVSVAMDGGSAHRIESSLQAALADEERTETILRERCSIPETVLSSRRFTEVYITAKQAQEFGLVNEVRDFTLPAGNQVFHI